MDKIKLVKEFVQDQLVICRDISRSSLGDDRVVMVIEELEYVLDFINSLEVNNVNDTRTITKD